MGAIICKKGKKSCHEYHMGDFQMTVCSIVSVDNQESFVSSMRAVLGFEFTNPIRFPFCCFLVVGLNLQPNPNLS
jgi:hypothetical protein